MEILSRLKALFWSWLGRAAPEQPEDPQLSLDRSLDRMEQSRRDIRRSLVEVNAARLRLQQQLARLEAGINQHDEQAEVALGAGEDDLAWEALQRKQEAVARRSEVEHDFSSLERQLASLKQSQANLERKIALFRSKKDTLKALHTSFQTQLSVQEALAGVSEELTDVNSTVERAERRIYEMQARAEAIEELISDGVLPDVLQPETDEIDRRLARIGRRQAVADELARLTAALSEEAAPWLGAGQAEVLAALKAAV